MLLVLMITWQKEANGDKMLEQLLRKRWIEHRQIYAFFLGLVYTIIAYITATIFFKDAYSIATMFLITILLVPSLMKLLNIEEKIERKDGTKHFLKDHAPIFKTYIFLFLGILAGYLVFGFFATGTDRFSNLFGYQLNFLESQGAMNFEKTAYEPMNKFMVLFTSNVLVALIAFVLSLFYGAGAVFLVVFNASIFSAFILSFMQKIGEGMQLYAMGIFSLHLVPELLGFLFAAVAGGVISKALLKEKFGTEEFSNVFKDATLILIIAVALILIAAFLETFVTTPFFYSLI